jgi:hypothetical protein
MGVQPSSGGFRGKCGAAIAYGLTSGGSNATEISIESIGMRIVRPVEEGDDLEARREALLVPRVLGEFLRKYDGSPLPRTDIAQNVLIDMGVPQEKAEDVLSLILASAEAVGFLTEIKGKKYVDLENTTPASSSGDDGEDAEVLDVEDEAEEESASNLVNLHKERQHFAGRNDASHETNKRRVFITHGKNTAFIEPIKKLLGFGELEAVVSGQRQSVSQPVPDKVIMTCEAAEQRLFM